MKKFLGMLFAAFLVMSSSMMFAQETAETKFMERFLEEYENQPATEMTEEEMIYGVSNYLTNIFPSIYGQADLLEEADVLISYLNGLEKTEDKAKFEKVLLSTALKLSITVDGVKSFLKEMESSGNSEYYGYAEVYTKAVADLEKIIVLFSDVKTEKLLESVDYINDMEFPGAEELADKIPEIKKVFSSEIMARAFIAANNEKEDVLSLAKDIKTAVKADKEKKEARNGVLYAARNKILSYSDSLKAEYKAAKKEVKNPENSEAADNLKAVEEKIAAAKPLLKAASILAPLTFDEVLGKVDDFVWGIPTIVLILLTGILLTIRLRGVQFTKLGTGFKSMFKKPEGGKGEVTPFAALCTALSATIGTGNIVGVATAIAAGGPGALFWMWFAALLGTATKYTECMLAVKYREHAADGHVLGGPFYTIEKGMKERTGFNWKWLAVLFAIFGVCVGLFGIGTFTQISGITTAVNNAFDPESANVAFKLFGNNYTWSVVIAGAIVTLAVALVVIGGLKRISKVAEKVVPAMAVIYVFLGLSILIMNATKIPMAFAVIFKSAFGWKAVAGGAMGFVFKQVTDSMQKGVARGIFSNEAGLGSAPIAASAAKVEEPVEQGIVSMLGTFIDTIIICTMTGLAIVIAFYTGTDYGNIGELKGVALTAAAFNKVLGGDGRSVQFLLMICLVFFAFTTILGWDYYSEKCLEYLTHGNMTVVKIFRWVYIIAVAIGPYFTISQVWTIADITNGLMAIPNCISLLVLSGVAARETKKYFDKTPKLKD